MKRLLLTSGGLRFAPVASEFLKLIDNKPKEIKFAHIMTASKMAKNRSYLEQDIQAFKNLGIRYEEIDIEKKTEEELQDTLKNFDVIYVQGGSPFFLLKHIKLSGFNHVIQELVRKGKLYVGVSAGSYVACPTIEQALWKKPDRDRYGLKDDEPALGLVPFLIVVHYQDEHKDTVRRGMEHTQYEVKILTDNQALLVEDGNVTLVGKGEEVTL